MARKLSVLCFIINCVDTNIELTLNGDIVTWSHDITHLGHHFICCFSLRKYINIRKGCFIQCVNEICTEFVFAHPKGQAKLLEIYGTNFHGSNLWDLYNNEFMSLGKTWNVTIRKVYNVPCQTYCRFLQHVSQLNHVTHMLTSRFIKFMVANRVGKLSMLLMLLIFVLEMQCPVLVGILKKIMSKYKLDFRLLQLPLVFNIKANMDIM